MQKSCLKCAQQFEITDEDLKFYDKVSPVFAGTKYAIPTPDLCSDCRLQQRLSFRHGGQLYIRKCDLSGKEMISMYPPETKIKVYEQNEWWSDKWDGLDFGRDFDFSKNFFKQFDQLYKGVPHISLINTNADNAYYCNHGMNQKNCYLIIGATDNSDSMYGFFMLSCKDVMDGISLTACQLCYEGVASSGCYNCKYFRYSKNCSDCFLIDNCRNCQYCIGCVGLNQKKYHIFNEDVGKEKYEEFAKQYLQPLTRQTLNKWKEKFEALRLKIPNRAMNIYNCENCTGDMVYESKNCQYAFIVNKSEDCKFISNSPHGRYSYDCSFTAPEGAQYCYQGLSTLGQNSLFNWMCWFGNECLYTAECHSCSHIFGCVGLRRASYCIFNKQYSKEEYEKLVGKIIEHMQKTGEWGSFFPVGISPYQYNESAANDHFPFNKAQALEYGMNWKEKDIKDCYRGTTTQVPDNIHEVSDDILKSILVCEECDTNYRLNVQELKFYRKMELPVPKKCFKCRHGARVKMNNPYKLYDRKCAKCSAEIKTTYAPDRPEIVYCEQCYLKEIY